MQLPTELFPQTPKVLTVAELTRAIRGLLETRFGAVWVQGEISNYKKHPSGHQYFTLKDQRAAISCVIFRNTLPPFPKPLSDGMQVQVYGQITVFEVRGAKTKTRGRRSLRFRSQTRVAEISASHRHCHFTERRSNSRHLEHSAP